MANLFGAFTNLKNEVEKKLVEAAAAAAGAAGDLVEALRRDKAVTVYPTYGYLAEGGSWTIPMRVWVNKSRRLPLDDDVIRFFLDDVVRRFQEDMGALDGEDITRLRTRVADFIADDDSGEEVGIRFDDDPEGTIHRLPAETDPNGLVQHDFVLPADKAADLLGRQESRGGWLKFTAVVSGFEGAGRARLVQPEGLSVVSDIDDTIKITEVPAGKAIVLRNVFLRDYAAVPGMREMYEQFGGDVMFHYVSGSPWQVYRLLDEFLIQQTNFPPGAFHMKDVRKNLLVSESWQDFKNFAAGDKATLAQKVGQITRLFLNLPRRRFILIGDSGEKDPEVFREIRKTFPAQVQQIIIRDVVNERAAPQPNRLDDMTVIEAPTVEHGVTQFRD